MTSSQMWAVQYRKYGGPEVLEVGRVHGAYVDAVTGDRTSAAAQAGAENIYDYRRGVVPQITQRHDAILATASARLLAYRKVLNPGGKIVALSPSAVPSILTSLFTPGPLIRMVSGKRIITSQCL